MDEEYHPAPPFAVDDASAAEGASDPPPAPSLFAEGGIAAFVSFLDDGMPDADPKTGRMTETIPKDMAEARPAA